MSMNSTQFEKMSNHSKLITIIKKLNTKRKNIKQTSKNSHLSSFRALDG